MRIRARSASPILRPKAKARTPNSSRNGKRWSKIRCGVTSRSSAPSAPPATLISAMVESFTPSKPRKSRRYAKAVASALQVTITAINNARRILQQIPSTSIELYEQAGEGVDQLDSALQIIGELDAATGDTNTDLSSTLDRIDLDFAEIIGTSKPQPNADGKRA